MMSGVGISSSDSPWLSSLLSVDNSSSGIKIIVSWLHNGNEGKYLVLSVPVRQEETAWLSDCLAQTLRPCCIRWELHCTHCEHSRRQTVGCNWVWSSWWAILQHSTYYNTSESSSKGATHPFIGEPSVFRSNVTPALFNCISSLISSSLESLSSSLSSSLVLLSLSEEESPLLSTPLAKTVQFIVLMMYLISYHGNQWFRDDYKWWGCSHQGH